MKNVKFFMVTFSVMLLLIGLNIAQATDEANKNEVQEEKAASQGDQNFIIQNVTFSKISRAYCRAKGEIINNSGESLRHTDFVVRVYDDAGDELDSVPFIIRNFKKDSTRSFNVRIKASTRKINSHKVEFKE